MLVFGVVPAWSQDAPVQYTISEVNISGARNVDESLIRSVAKLSAGNPFNSTHIADSIRQLYRLGLFSDVRVTGAFQGNQVALTIEVKEYPLLERIEFIGNEKIKDKTLEKEATIYQGQAVNHYRRQVNREKLLDFYRQKGYLLAEIEDRVLVTGNWAVLEIHIDEGKKVELGEIFAEGNDHLSDKQIQKAVKKKTATEEDYFWKEGDLSRERILDQLAKVEDLYRKHGFREARVVSDSMWFSDSKEKMYMKLVVEEGPRSYVGKIDFEGNTVFTDEQLNTQFLLKEGEVFNEERYKESIGKLYEAYGEEGYLYANPFPREIVRGDTVDLLVSVVENEPAHVHRINIVGNTKTKDKVIRRELVVKPGQVFKRSALMRSQREIFQLNFFQDVIPNIHPLQNGDVDVSFQVQEKPTGTANAGAGFSGLDGLVGTLSLNIPNFLGNGQTVNLGWEFGARRNSISMGFVEPWLFDTPTSLGIDLFRTVRFWFGEFRIRNTGFGLTLGRRIRNSYFRISGGYRLSNLKYTDFIGSYFPDGDNPDPNRIQQREDLIASSGLTSSVSNAIIRDSRDFPQFATRGTRHSVSTIMAGLGGDVKYLKQVYTSDWYFPLFLGTSFSLKSKFAYVHNPFNSRLIPFDERYFPGGVSFDGMIRGYSNVSVGPYAVLLDQNNNILATNRLGGKSMLIFTLEYQIPIVHQRKSTSPVYAIAFADAGNAWLKINQTSAHPGDLKKSVGFGIRVAMPLLGLMGFDFGYGFDPPADPFFAQRQKRSGWNTHFQLGQTF